MERRRASSHGGRPAREPLGVGRAGFVGRGCSVFSPAPPSLAQAANDITGYAFDSQPIEWEW